MKGRGPEVGGNVCVRIYVFEGKSRKDMTQGENWNIWKSLRRNVKKRASQRSDTEVWEREKKRTAVEEQAAGKRRSWSALWQLWSIPRRITRAVDATNCQQEASSLEVHGRNTGTSRGHMRDFSQLYPLFLSSLP